MDMTPEQLFDLLEPERKAKQLTALHVTRCPYKHHGCFHIGTYEYRGQQVTIATRVRFSQGKADKLGLPSRDIPGRAWVGAPPTGQVYGCNHTHGTT